jgi:hypothetical protein
MCITDNNEEGYLSGADRDYSESDIPDDEIPHEDLSGKAKTTTITS